MAALALSMSPPARCENEPPSPPPEAAAVMGVESAGASLLLKNDLAGAEAAFREALAASPGAPGPLLGLAEVEIRRNQPAKAREWLERAQALAPQDPIVRAKLGRVYAMAGDNARAEALFNEAIDLDPRSVVAHMGLGDLYVGPLKRPTESIAHYQAIIKSMPGFGPAYLGLGRAHAELHNFDEAARNFRAAAGLARNSPLPYYALGRLYAEQKRFDEAIAAFDLALRINPQFLPAVADRAIAFGQTGRDRQAVADLETLASASPTDAVTRFRLGIVYYRLGRKSEAMTVLLEAIKYKPDLAVAYNLLAWIAAESKSDLPDALIWAKKAIELGPEEPGFQDTLGWVHRARGEPDLAIAALAKAIAMEPQRPIFHYHLGVVYAESGRRGEAASALERSLAIDANFSEAADARRRLTALSK